METPIFVYKQEMLEKTLDLFSSFDREKIKVLFAMKSANHPEVLCAISQRGFGFDIATANELKYLFNHIHANFEVSFSAPSKFECDINFASCNGVKMYVCDSEHEIRKVIAHAQDPEIVLRIEIPNHGSVFKLSSKFGMTADYVQHILEIGRKEKWNIKGFAFHVGSQNAELDSWTIALETSCELANAATRLGYNIEILNMGGGIPAAYSSGEIGNLQKYIDHIIGSVNSAKSKFEFSRYYIEPGRSISANSMSMITKIIGYKECKTPPILVVDTSVFHGLIEAIDGSVKHPIHLYGRESTVHEKEFKVVGFTCDGWDVIRDSVYLPGDLSPNDLLEIDCAGAYSYVLRNYHLMDYAPIEC
jgi:ornithine decarboxylase